MASIPPTLSAETGTPADEWAHSTTAAIAHPDTAPATSSGATPAFERADSTPFPGAFPKSNTPLADSGVASGTQRSASPEVGDNASRGSVASRAMQSVTDAAQTVSSTASQYLPKVAGAVSSYMPGNGTASASEHDATHATSMPSGELEGAAPGEQVRGVGALPGSVSEQSVSRLPDERTGPQGLKQSAPVSTVPQPLSAATYPTAPYESTTQNSTTGPRSDATAATPRLSMPTQEERGTQPFEHQDGAGALPGRTNERGVAALPDETHGGAGATGATSAAVGTHARTYDASPAMPSREQDGNDHLDAAVGGVGALPGGADEAGVARLPDEREKGTAGVAGMAERAKETAKTAVGHGSEHQYALGAADAQWHGVGVGASYQQGRGVDVEPRQREGETDHPAEQRATTDTAPTDAAPTQQSGAHGEKTKKVGFMGKMRGEAKILLGRVEGKSGKVEEGRKMKAGET